MTHVICRRRPVRQGQDSLRSDSRCDCGSCREDLATSGVRDRRRRAQTRRADTCRRQSATDIRKWRTSLRQRTPSTCTLKEDTQVIKWKMYTFLGTTCMLKCEQSLLCWFLNLNVNTPSTSWLCSTVPSLCLHSSFNLSNVPIVTSPSTH